VDEVAHATQNDPLLQKISELTLVGWPNVTEDPDVKAYFPFRTMLSLHNNCLLLGQRVVIPQSLQARVLHILHQGHPGVVRSKMLARSTVWWPTMGKDIELAVSNCNVCTKVNFKPITNETTPWPPAKFPFERVHVDFFQFEATNFFIFVDAFSKWCHVGALVRTNAEAVLEQLLSLFAVWGYPTKIVSDNAPPFIPRSMFIFALILTLSCAMHRFITLPQTPWPNALYRLLKRR